MSAAMLLALGEFAHAVGQLRQHADEAAQVAAATPGEVPQRLGEHGPAQVRLCRGAVDLGAGGERGDRGVHRGVELVGVADDRRKSGSGGKCNGRPASRSGVHTTTSVSAR